MAMAILVSAAIVQPAWAGPAEDGMSAAAQGDFDLARRLWVQAANKGDAAAAFLLGDMYEHGRGIDVDRVEAGRWYFLAAEKGNAVAKARLAAITDDAFAAITGATKGKTTGDSDDAQARFDRDLASIQARFDAYKACALREARRLEPSGERADLVVQAALRACEPARKTLRGDTPSAGGMMNQVMAGFDDEARQDATLAVVEVRAKRAAPAATRPKQSGKPPGKTPIDDRNAARALLPRWERVV
jgi:hypothetical protein